MHKHDQATHRQVQVDEGGKQLESNTTSTSRRVRVKGLGHSVLHGAHRQVQVDQGGKLVEAGDVGARHLSADVDDRYGAADLVLDSAKVE